MDIEYKFKLLFHRLKYREVRIGIGVGVGIFLISVIIFLLIDHLNPNIFKPKMSADICFQRGIDHARQFFQQNCKGDECQYLELTETEMQGFYEYSVQLRKDCEQKYGVN